MNVLQVERAHVEKLMSPEWAMPMNALGDKVGKTVAKWCLQ